MTENRDLEHRLRSWLDEDGPQDVPDRVVDVAIAQAGNVRRQRPLPGFVGTVSARWESITAPRMPMTRAWILLALLVALLAASAVLAGALLSQYDRARSIGSIAYDAGGDLWILGGRPGDVPIRLTATNQVEERNPVWSPSGRFLAYWVTEGGRAEVHVLDYEEDGRRIILRERDDLLLPLHDSIFGWSPDERMLAVPARAASADGTEVGIEAVALFDVESRAISLVPIDGPAWSFGWSPDGRYLGLVGRGDLFVFDSRTSEVRPLRGGREPGATVAPYWLRQIPPVFSADGRAVIFTDEPADGGSTGDILALHIEDAEAEPIVAGLDNELAAVLSRDGEHLAFGRSPAVTIYGAISNGPGQAGFASELFVMPASGGPPVGIATSVWPRAAWSPDSRRLVTKSFASDELVIIDLDRPEGTAHIPMPAAVGGYSWGPHPP